jgi:hypothetical protein
VAQIGKWVKLMGFIRDKKQPDNTNNANQTTGTSINLLRRLYK